MTLNHHHHQPSKLFYDLNLHYGLRKNKQKSLMFGSILPKILNTQQLPRFIVVATKVMELVHLGIISYQCPNNPGRLEDKKQKSLIFQKIMGVGMKVLKELI
uniref:Uncharacterized protein n=1 Tax=Lactuca sativa TaxID=4236 RepID=A0A9R1UVL1_LACSA|nr:hypothetical protein LSAT_V11C800395360 [Lactuca sativa]